jgi:hypothetical protein
VHAVSQRAWGLRLRGTTHRLAFAPACVLPSPSVHKVGVPDWIFEARYPAH